MSRVIYNGAERKLGDLCGTELYFLYCNIQERTGGIALELVNFENPSKDVRKWTRAYLKAYKQRWHMFYAYWEWEE